MVRYGKFEDLEDVNKIRIEVSELHLKNEPTFFKPGFPEEKRDYLKEFINGEEKMLLVCEENGKICGYAMLSLVIKPESIYRYEQKLVDVEEFGVSSHLKGKGYGTQLMNKIKEITKQKGYDQIILNVWSFNENAIKFYKKQGFNNYNDRMRFFV